MKSISNFNKKESIKEAQSIVGGQGVGILSTYKGGGTIHNFDPEYPWQVSPLTGG